MKINTKIKRTFQDDEGRKAGTILDREREILEFNIFGGGAIKRKFCETVRK